jgi:alpha-L-fucosidase
MADDLGVFLDLIDELGRAHAVDETMVERQRQIRQPLHSEFRGVLGQAVVDFAQEEGRHCGWDDDGHGIAQTERLHIGQADRDGLVRLVLAISGQFDLNTGLLGKALEIECVGLFHHRQDQFVARQRDGNAEIDVVVSAQHIVASQGRAEGRELLEGLHDGIGKTGEGGRLEISAMGLHAIFEVLDGLPIDGHRDGAGNDELSASLEAGGEEPLFLIERDLSVAATHARSRRRSAGSDRRRAALQKCVDVARHKLRSGSRNGAERFLRNSLLFGVGSRARRNAGIASGASCGFGCRGRFALDRWGGFGGSAVNFHLSNAFGDFHLRNGIADGKNRVRFGQPSHQRAFVGRFHVHDRLIGFHLVNRLIPLDGVAGLFQNGDQTSFLETFSDLRYANFYDRHGLEFPNLRRFPLAGKYGTAGLKLANPGFPAGRRSDMLAALFVGAILGMPTAPLQQPPKPSARQSEWQKLEYYAFVHFGPNTFTDKEWGEGKEDPNVFEPTKLDCRQWVRTFKEAGMRQVIITAKHHDGFCLWPSKYSTHTVAHSGWKGGRGDVLAELRKACDEYGLKLGVYLSPWDRNHPAYGTPEYNKVFASMLAEVLDKYGPIHEVWFDGANGEGPNGRRQVYDWELFNATVRKHAPQAVIFSDAGPDIRWVGNEQGIAPETCWSTIPSGRYVPGTPHYQELAEGKVDGDLWVPAECDVSIRPGWFYHASEDAKVKSPQDLMDIYMKSVGRNGALLLNVPPDRRGLIADPDIRALRGFRALRDKLFKHELKGKQGQGLMLASGPVEQTRLSKSFTLEFERPARVATLVLQEDIASGQHIRSFEVWSATKSGERLSMLAKGTSIGAKRILAIQPVEVELLKIRVTAVNREPQLKVRAFAPAR